MKNKPTISFVVRNKLCNGCGICVDACPTQAISMKTQKGLFVPIINNNLCINDKGCSKCFQVCPGIGIDLKNKSKQLYEQNDCKYDNFIGYHQNCYSGFSNDHNIRYHSASGGLLSQLLIYLLQKKLIAGAVVTRFKQEFPSTPETIIATSREEILSGKSSKYCPVSQDGIISEIKKREGKYVIVGLPCHIHGFRKYEKTDSVFRDKVLGYFSIYCSSTRTFLATEYLFNYYKIDPKNLNYFAYRDDGCLGFLKAISDNQEIKVPYRKYYSQLRSFFKPKRCLTCIDHYGYLADICFGDIQTGRYKSDTIGVNSVITRSRYFDDLIVQAKNEGVISLKYINSSIINESQQEMLQQIKKNIFALNMVIDKMLGNAIPKYDVMLEKSFSMRSLFLYISIKIQRQIGKHKIFWFIIKFINKLSEKKYTLFKSNGEV